jgi:hypothetical protein
MGVAGTAGDVAYLYGASSGSNVLVATPSYAYLYGSNYVSEGWGFAFTEAISESSNDSAYFYGSGSSGDTYGQGNGYAYLYGADFFNYESGFRNAYRAG